MLLLPYSTIACLFCLLVLLCLRLYIYILVCSVWLGCFLFLLFFLTHFTNSNFALSCCDRIFTVKVPRSARFVAVSVFFFLSSGLGVLLPSAVLLVLSSCSLLLFFFSLFLCCFPSLHFLGTFLASGDLLVFSFFLLFLARLLSGLFIHACGPPATPFAPSKNPWMLCGKHVATTISLWPFPPPRAYPQLCPARPSITIFVFFCVYWVPIHTLVPIRTHPHPPESLLTPSYLHAHMCLLGGIIPC